MDRARQVGADDHVVKLANQVLAISVLSIMITAPLGALFIGITGPKLLRRNDDNKGFKQNINIVMLLILFYYCGKVDVVLLHCYLKCCMLAFHKLRLLR